MTFLCETHYNREIKGVKRLVIKKEISQPKASEKVFKTSSQKEVSLRYSNAFRLLKKQGYSPNYVISHSGWGCGTYIKAYWPKCKLISYIEWWFAPESEFYNYDQTNKDLNINPNTAFEHWPRNQQLALELGVSDTLITPSVWQKNQLPKFFADKTNVIFDGIDLNKFRSAIDNKSKVPLVTYGTRGMEPIRAFKQFIIEIPRILNASDDTRVEIAGYDNLNYGGLAPKGYKSWGNWAFEYLKAKKVDDRVKWLGYLDDYKYINWLKSSWCHIYLTHPFVLSWSFIESLAAGCPIVCSEVAPVLEYGKQPGCKYIDHRIKGNISEAVISILQDKSRWEKSNNRNLRFADQDISYAIFKHVTGFKLATPG